MNARKLNVAAGEDGPTLYAHVVVGKSDGTAHGGHLIEGRVRPTLEIRNIGRPAWRPARSRWRDSPASVLVES